VRACLDLVLVGSVMLWIIRNMPVDASAGSIFLAACASSHSLSLFCWFGISEVMVADMRVVSAFYKCGLEYPIHPDRVAGRSLHDDIT